VADASSEPEVNKDTEAKPVSPAEPARETIKALPVENSRVVKTQRATLISNTPTIVAPTPQPEPAVASVVVATPPPQPPPRPVDHAPAKELNEPVRTPAPSETAASYKSSRLLIASVAVPQSFTIIVNVDNEPFFSRNATAVANFPVEDRTGRIQ